MLQCSPPPRCKRQNWRKPRQWRSSCNHRSAQALTTSINPGILTLLKFLVVTLAALHGRFCFM